MAASKRKARPPAGALIGVRLPGELLAAIDAARGTVERSTWVRQVIEDHLVTGDLRAIREVVEYAARRGVTGEQLAAAAALLPD
jgi:hypothetical protein